MESIVTGLDLANNGLSGKLTVKIASLSSLQILDLSDNDIKVSLVPSKVVWLLYNTYLTPLDIMLYLPGHDTKRDWY